MSQIKRIEISGFRGVPTQLSIPFPSGKVRSLILYGANGTGKSTITDAWEWIAAGKIEHLAREGAEENAYPNLSAKPGTTYVEIEFFKPELGTVKLTFNTKRVRSPISTGKLAELRKLVAHPCHVRHADLTRFVLLTKSERFDALASLMGFVPQMEYQKTLRRVSEQLTGDLKIQRGRYLDAKKRSEEHFVNRPGETLTPIELIVCRLAEYGIACDGSEARLTAASKELKELVIKDPNAKKLAATKTIRGAIGGFVPGTSVAPKVKTLREAISTLRASQAVEREKILRIPLFLAAQDLLVATPKSGICPLCNQTYGGDLKEHVAAELLALQRLKGQVTSVNVAKQNLVTALTDNTQETIYEIPEGFTPSEDLKVKLEGFDRKVTVWRKSLRTTKDLLTFDTSALSAELVESLSNAEASTQKVHDELVIAKRELIETLDALATALEQDPRRKKLVEDADYVATGLRLHRDEAASLAKGHRIREVNERFTELVNRFVAVALKDVTDRFDQISGKVTEFFAILEAGTPGIGAPRLVLDESKDRSVVLEVVFREQPISPAYKYLSESQLNSFGLAVALASAVHFNKDFQFLILDDVVNSCDAYKRSQLIEILEKHLAHVQVLLLTHDKMWRDLLYRRLPQWGRLEFQRYEIGVGPICAPGKDIYAQITDDIARDDATNASTRLARYMEEAAQEIGEAFEIVVKFNRRGEYTLDPLLNAIRDRLQSKLGAAHPVTQHITRVTQDNAYRNWSIHCKSGGTPITNHEINTVVNYWQGFEQMIRCPKCGGILTYADPGFRCGCGATTLSK